MIKLLFPNVVYDSSFNGGNWQSGDMSLDALRDPVMSHVARSVDADNDSTCYNVAFNRPRTIGGIALLNHNFSLSSRIRITLSRNSDMSDPSHTEEFEVYPRLYDTRLLPFEAPNWFLGRPTRDDIALTTTIAVCIFDRDYPASYARVEIFDANNPDGFVEFGKPFLGSTFRPSQNYSTGGQFSVADSSQYTESMNGTRFFNKKSKRRSFAFGFSTLDEKMYFAQHYDLMVRAGITEELLCVPDPEDLINLQRRSFCGMFRELNPLEQFSYDKLNVSYVVEEQL